MSDKNNIIHNIFNNPLPFIIVRSLLDGGQLNYLKKILKDYDIKDLLDVGCGIGDFSQITDKPYFGIDYNPNFISFCNKKFGNKNKEFKVADINNFTIKKRFDASILINTIHHLNDEEVIKILKNIKKSTKRIIMIHDALQQKNIISKFFYKLDRGEHFRSIEQQKFLLEKANLKIEKILFFRSFPGIYLHSTIICSP